MPGTRTAPDVGVATPNYKLVSLNMIDSVGDSKSNSFVAATGATNAEIETYAAETQERSNASLFEVQITSVYFGARSKGNALEAVFNNIQDNIRYSIKAGPTTRQYAYIPSPLEAMFLAGTETPDATALNDWFAAVLAVAGAGWTGLNYGFVEHKDRNQSIKF